MPKVIETLTKPDGTTLTRTYNATRHQIRKNRYEFTSWRTLRQPVIEMLKDLAIKKKIGPYWADKIVRLLERNKHKLRKNAKPLGIQNATDFSGSIESMFVQHVIVEYVILAKDENGKYKLELSDEEKKKFIDESRLCDKVVTIFIKSDIEQNDIEHPDEAVKEKIRILFEKTCKLIRPYLAM